MEGLDSVGFKHIWILETGKSAWGEYQGPHEKLIDIGISNVMKSLSILNAMDLPDEIERVVLLDNDCFIFDPLDTLEYVDAFEKGRYDIASLYGIGSELTKGSQDIIIPYDLSKVARKLSPTGIAYAIFRKSIWQRIRGSKNWFEPGKEPGAVWERFAGLDPTFGVHRIRRDKRMKDFIRINRPGSYSQYEKGRWFHMGNLISPYFQVENGMFHSLYKLDKAYFCKYFPERVDYSGEYVAIWEEFMNIATGEEELVDPVI